MTAPARSESQNARAARGQHGEVIGDRILCAWKTAPGFCRVQTRSPKYARKLTRRADAELVAYSCTGEFLRVFRFKHSLAWARALISRYTASETVTSEAKTVLKSPADGERAEGGVM